MKINILNIYIDNFSKSDALENMRQFLHDDKQHKIFTPNPEMFVLAARDQNFKKILNSADLLVPDGFGLILVSHFLGRPFRERITGVDLIKNIVKLASEEQQSIFLLGGSKGVGELAANKLKNLINQTSKILPIGNILEGIKIDDGEKNSVEIDGGGKDGVKIEWLDGVKIDKHATDQVIREINNKKPDILFVALGHGKQERFINENLSKMPSVKVAIGIGGALDLISGRIHRAPRWLQKLGLEWLWRLVLQPWRFLRIVNALLIFPIKVFIWKKSSLGDVTSPSDDL